MKTLAAFLLLAVARPALADLSLCNNGAFDLYAAHAEWKGEGLLGFTRHWNVSGWYELPRNECRVVYTGDLHRFYVAFAFTDARGRWGSAEFEPEDEWSYAKNELCVRRGEVFEYKLDDEDPPGCPDGYFTLPGTIVFEPDGDKRFEVTIGLDRDAVAGPTGLALDELRGNPQTQERGGTLERAAGVVGAVIGVAIAIGAASEAERAAAPKPFASGTLNTSLFGHALVRRTNGNGLWYTADGDLLQPGYALDGATSSPVLDAPTQRSVDDPAVVAALAQVNRGLASLALNHGAHISSEGRLELDFEWNGGSTLQRWWTNISTLDFSRGRSLAGDGLVAYRIPCRDDRACVVAFEEDAAGKLSTPLLLTEIDIAFASDADGQQVWAGLLELLALYPEEPVVAVR
jgi:uncharacterized membrane protein